MSQFLSKNYYFMGKTRCIDRGYSHALSRSQNWAQRITKIFFLWSIVGRGQRLYLRRASLIKSSLLTPNEQGLMRRNGNWWVALSAFPRYRNGSYWTHAHVYVLISPCTAICYYILFNDWQYGGINCEHYHTIPVGQNHQFFCAKALYELHIMLSCALAWVTIDVERLTMFDAIKVTLTLRYKMLCKHGKDTWWMHLYMIHACAYIHPHNYMRSNVSPNSISCSAFVPPYSGCIMSGFKEHSGHIILGLEEHSVALQHGR